MIVNNDTINWLLAGDPSIRWQTMRDLLKSTDSQIAHERIKVAREGWGRKLLSYQDTDGKWAGQLYGNKWISTTYTMLLLKELGVLPDKNTARGCNQIFNNGLFKDEEIRFSKGQKLRDNGITGLALGILCYFKHPDKRLHNIANFLARIQNQDGSWYFDNRAGAEKYCFETTMVVLKGLLEYHKIQPEQSNEIIEAQRRGREFLLGHKLFKKKGADKPINDKWLLFSFPYYWFYDILVALDYFRESSHKDIRLTEAVSIVLKKQNKDATWNLQNRHPGKVFFEMEPMGKPSRWNTLRCLRVIDWWNSP